MRQERDDRARSMPGMLDRIVATALALPAARRESYLQRVAMRWPELAHQARSELDRLLQLGQFLEPLPDHRSWLQGGDLIGSYRVLSFHARGAFGEVYLAEHASEPAGPIALKVAPADKGREIAAAILVGAHIPHLVEVFAAGRAEHDGRALDYVAMRFVSGTPLSHLLEAVANGGHRFDQTTRRLLVQRLAEVAEALAGLHARGLVHLDVKPANILIEAGNTDRDTIEGSAVLVDLGLLRPIGAASVLSTVYATLPYAAPEQVLGLDVDGRADVFALGVTMHDLLASRTPAKRQRRPAAGLEPLERLTPGFDRDLRAIVAEAVEPDRSRRYDEAAVLAQDLRAWLAGTPVSVRPRGVLGRAHRMLRRQPGRFMVVLAGGVAVLVIAVLLAWVGQVALRDRALVRQAAERLAEGKVLAALRTEGEVSAIGRWLWPLPSHAGAWSGVGDVVAEDPQARAEDLAELVAMAGDEVPRALQFAARLLARDGMGVHPALARWLVQTVAEEDRSLGLQAAQGLAHLLLDRPMLPPLPERSMVRSPPGGSTAARPDDGIECEIAASLAGLVARNNDPLILAYLAAALGGCPGRPSADEQPGAAEALVALLERLSREPRFEHEELCRVATANLLRVMSRWCTEPDRTRREQAWEELPELLGRAVMAADRLEDVRPGVGRACTRQLEELFFLLAGHRRRHGQALPDPRMFHKLARSEPRVWAAARHPEAFEKIETFDRRCEHEVGVSCLQARLMGELLGLAGEAPAADGWWTKAQRRLVDNGCDPSLVDRWMRVGYAVGQGLLVPEPGLWTPDEGSRLLDWFDLRSAGFVDLGGVPSEEVAEPTLPELARCEFHLGAVRWHGTVLGVEGRAVRLEPDELEDGQTFLWLGCAGESAVRLTFRTRPGGFPLLRLRVWVQKGRRPSLPYTGHAGLTLTLDGRPLTAISDLTAPMPQTIRVPLGQNPHAATEHTLELRLRADANTTLRIYEVVVE